jgi:hypothetical protein
LPAGDWLRPAGKGGERKLKMYKIISKLGLGLMIFAGFGMVQEWLAPQASWRSPAAFILSLVGVLLFVFFGNDTN